MSKLGTTKESDVTEKGDFFMTTRKAQRAGRKFSSPESIDETISSGNVSCAGGYFLNQKKKTSKSSVFEMKTAKGLLIKIYVGSIIQVNVDSIVSASNERLMHIRGVAAAISKAAGKQFDQETAQYIAANGPVPVGSCCVTSAGNLPYKCVIHTVGPRWSDYRDSNVCLELLQSAVTNTFLTADNLEMTSVAIPAISAGWYHFIETILKKKRL